MNGDIHNRKGRIKSTTTKIKEADHISDYNREILLDFKSYLISQDLSDDRLCRYLYNWYQLTELVNWNLDETSKEGIQVIVEKINKGDFREDLSPHTKAEYKKAIRKLFTDYFASKSHKYQPIGQGYDGEELCDFFSLTVDDENLDREELPTPELAKRFVREANSLRDKAFIMTLWSSAGRIGEVLGLQWKHIRFDTRKGEEIVKLKFEDQKIGGNRKVPLRAGYLYLKQLQESDPRGDDPDAFVFRSTTTDRQMSHNAGCGILNRIRDRIDRKAEDKSEKIPNHVKTNPHAWRKGRATDLASRGMNQSTLCEFGGWVQGSSNVSKYVRLAEADVENGVKSLYDMETEDSQERDLEPVKCHSCGELNRFEAESCQECDATLQISKLYQESRIDEMTDELVYEVAKDKAGLSEEEIRERAEKVVKKEW